MPSFSRLHVKNPEHLGSLVFFHGKARVKGEFIGGSISDDFEVEVQSLKVLT